MDSDNGLLTVNEVAAHLRAAPATVRRRLRKKTLRHVRIGAAPTLGKPGGRGGPIRIPASEIARFTA